MVYVLVNKKNKRIKLLSGKTTPAFDFPVQAYNYAESRGMKYYNIRKV